MNDGVCDCCDGSDEWNSAVKCSNTCRQLAEVGIKERRAALADVKAAIVTRDSYLDKAAVRGLRACFPVLSVCRRSCRPSARSTQNSRWAHASLVQRLTLYQARISVEDGIFSTAEQLKTDTEKAWRVARDEVDLRAKKAEEEAQAKLRKVRRRSLSLWLGLTLR